MEYIEYIRRFEVEVIVKGYFKGLFGKDKNQIIPIRELKLSKTEFGLFIGRQFESDKLVAINYYGLFKLSSEIFRAIEKAKTIYGSSSPNIVSKITSIMAPVVHFNSIKIEHVKQLAPELYNDFPDVKKYIVDIRWNKSNGLSQ